MQREIIDYKLLKDNSPYDLTDQVTDWIERHFQLHGSPCVAINNNECIYIQAMVKYKESE
jgi:hypothetical protein